MDGLIALPHLLPFQTIIFITINLVAIKILTKRCQEKRLLLG